MTWQTCLIKPYLQVMTFKINLIPYKIIKWSFVFWMKAEKSTEFSFGNKMIYTFFFKNKLFALYATELHNMRFFLSVSETDENRCLIFIITTLTCLRATRCISPSASYYCALVISWTLTPRPQGFPGLGDRVFTIFITFNNYVVFLIYFKLSYS